jgi:hypothetical protein
MPQREKRGSDALYFAPQFSPLLYAFDIHSEIFLSRFAAVHSYLRAFAIFSSSADSDFL